MSEWKNITIPPAEVLNGVGSSAADRALMLAADRTPVRLIYGEDRLTGRLLNAAVSADGKYLVAQFLWGFECDSISDVLLNDRALPAGTIVTHYRGDQVLPPGPIAGALATQGITYTTTLNGYAQTVVELPIKLFDGQINISARVRGRRLYDPRKDGSAGGAGSHRVNNPSTWEWSDCPALAYADWTRNTVYGAGLDVVWTSVVSLANADDALVGAEKRRTLGLTLDTPADVRAIAETFRAYAGCFALPTADGVRFVPDADGASVADLSHENGDLLAFDSLEMRDTSTSPTAVEVIFSDRTKIPWRDGSAIATLPGAGTTKPWRLSQVRLPGVTRFSQAMREAIERLNKLTLNDMSTVVEVAAEGIKFEEADIVRFSHPIGPVLKPMRIAGPPIMVDRGRWRLQLQEHDPAVYNDSVQTQPSVPDSSFDNPAGPPSQVTGLSASVSTLLITLTRTPTTELDYAYTEYQYSTNGGGTYNDIPAVPINDGRGGAKWQTSIQGALRIRARDVDTDNLYGAWSLAYDFTVGPEILPGASSTLAIKINVGDFAGSTNYSEAYIHGRDSAGAAADVNGTILLNGASVSVSKGSLVTSAGPVSAFIVWDSVGAGFSTTIPDFRPWAMARKVNGGWQYDNNSGWLAFTPTAAHYVIGLIQTGGPDTGAPGSPPGILSATMLSSAWVPDVIAALGTTADWVGVTNRPSTYRIGAVGLAAAGFSIPGNLYDADTGSVLLVGASMYRVAKINRATKAITDLGGFNPLSGSLGPLGECNAMAAALNSIDSAHIAVVYTNDEPAGNRLLGNLPAAMYRCGASRAVWGSSAFQYRGAYILVGIGGCGEGNGAENYAGAVGSDPNSWCETTFQITASGALVVSGASRGATTLLDYGYLGSLDATTNKQYEQDTDPTVSPGGVVDGAYWRVLTGVNAGRWYFRAGGAWRPSVGPGTINTPEIADGAVMEIFHAKVAGPIDVTTVTNLQRINVPTFSVNVEVITTVTLSYDLTPGGSPVIRRCWGSSFFGGTLPGVNPSYNTAPNDSLNQFEVSQSFTGTFQAFAGTSGYYIDVLGAGQGGLAAAYVRNLEITVQARKR